MEDHLWGAGKEYALPTAIVDMNAGSGELYIEETGQTTLGSAGHALELKFGSSFPTEALELLLVEENEECFARLKNVTSRRWPELPVDVAEGPVESNRSGVYLLNLDLEGALEALQDVKPGNSIFFFDPLLHVEWRTIHQVARSRIKFPLQTGTEFIIFLFTSDWFTGREYAWREDLSPLPRSSDSAAWTAGESQAVRAADGLFGDRRWRQKVLQNLDLTARQRIL
ncbi:MAG: hypothetical protein ACE5KH_04130, partial [Candidatus Geothermarchaeales archaeon]